MTRKTPYFKILQFGQKKAPSGCYPNSNLLNGCNFIARTGIFIMILCCVKPNALLAQTSFEGSMSAKFDSLFHNQGAVVRKKTLYNNGAPTSLMSPTGFGGNGTYIYGGLGGVYPEQYRNNKADLIAFGGLSFGDPIKYVNIALGLNMTDVHKFQDFSGNFSISRLLPGGSSISVGGLQLFANKRESDSPSSTFYAAFSHAVQGLPSKTPGASALSYTIGFGTGRFRDKSPADVLNDKGLHGTSVFAGISYEIIYRVNLNAEWYGTNLGLSAGFRPFKNPLSFSIGASNLVTSYSGDRVSMIFMMGYPLSVSRLVSK
ncbi:hypothetical protein [Mucilaginibacter ginsenosidivorax]|uniref:Type IX secretion system membrane protein PorP/SprF n=1 Tax=Mucilaginibacter ginsenosidivorax TaxID=862126 RepID=A0A5B8VZ73_9SPHI|nr:hypothetical protein [Mucilaginibacter ginsenosidivorax]QEC76683.1 hypothetical protein FSB76_12250 [Mucilaginibacter ginsenosidivorax]